jgi:hypothetical protein
MTLPMFHPFDQLAPKLLDNLMDDEDGAHDLSHIVRVWRNAKVIHREEGGDLEVLAAAVLLHDCVQVAKDSPLRSKASLLAANEARVRLAALEWAPCSLGCKGKVSSPTQAKTGLEWATLAGAQMLFSAGGESNGTYETQIADRSRTTLQPLYSW